MTETLKHRTAVIFLRTKIFPHIVFVIHFLTVLRCQTLNAVQQMTQLLRGVVFWYFTYPPIITTDIAVISEYSIMSCILYSTSFLHHFYLDIFSLNSEWQHARSDLKDLTWFLFSCPFHLVFLPDCRELFRGLPINIIIIIVPLRVFNISVSWFFTTRVCVKASLLKFQELSSVFWLILIIQRSG